MHKSSINSPASRPGTKGASDDFVVCAEQFRNFRNGNGVKFWALFGKLI